MKTWESRVLQLCLVVLLKILGNENETFLLFVIYFSWEYFRFLVIRGHSKTAAYK